jgi:IS605 OrfB family transposase
MNGTDPAIISINAPTQVVTAKLKLWHTPEQKAELDRFCFAYRDALNYTSKVAFENKKLSSSSRIQKLVYEDLRNKFNLPSQIACSVCRQVGATYKGLWTKVKQNSKQLKAGTTKKRYKGLDNAPKYISRTAILNCPRDFGFKKEQTVSVQSLDKRIVVRYTGYNPHLEYIRSGARLGEAKLWYSKSAKQYYLLVSVHVPTPVVRPEDITRIKGCDLGQRNLAVTEDTEQKIIFYNGSATLHKSNKIAIQRKSLQKKGTRSATRKLRELSGRERRFKADKNHCITKQIVEKNTVIGMEELTHIRERTAHKRRKGKRASVKQRKANANNSRWAFAETQSFMIYKSNLIGAVYLKVDADYTSQMCRCGYTSKLNRPNGATIFRCVKCGFQIHSDIVGTRNIKSRTILIWQDYIRTGVLVRTPNVSDKEAKAERLKRYAELRWSLDTSPRALVGGV